MEIKTVIHFWQLLILLAVNKNFKNLNKQLSNLTVAEYFDKFKLKLWDLKQKLQIW